MARKDSSDTVVVKQVSSAPTLVVRRVVEGPESLVARPEATRVQQTRHLLDGMQVLWSGNALSESDRKVSVGRQAARWLDVALAVHNSLGPAGVGTPEERDAVKAQLDSALGGLDGGSSDGTFETGAVVEQLAYAVVCMDLADEVEVFLRRLRDTALAAGANGVERTQLAVGLLKQVVKARPNLRSVTPLIFDELRNMAAKAIAARLEKEREAEQGATPAPTPSTTGGLQ